MTTWMSELSTPTTPHAPHIEPVWKTTTMVAWCHRWSVCIGRLRSASQTVSIHSTYLVARSVDSAACMTGSSWWSEMQRKYAAIGPSCTRTQSRTHDTTTQASATGLTTRDMKMLWYLTRAPLTSTGP